MPDNSIKSVQPLVHVEKSASIDPRISRKKKQRQLIKRKKHQQRMDGNIDEQIKENDDSGHIDYRA